MIRRFDIHDTDAVMSIWITENIKAHDFIAKEYWENNFEYVKSILPDSEMYVYTDDNKILGFIGLNDCYIEGVFIHSDNQNKGIGTALLNKVKSVKSSLTLNVYEKNIKAIKFYQKNGFKIIRENTDTQTNEQEYTMMWENSL